MGPALVLLAGSPLRVTSLTVPLFAVVTLMWTVLSLIASGVDSILVDSPGGLVRRWQDLARLTGGRMIEVDLGATK